MTLDLNARALSIAVLVCSIAGVEPAVAASDASVIHLFKAGANGDTPELGTIVADKSGNLFGTSTGLHSGFKNNWGGTVYELVPPANGKTKWTFVTIYKFPLNPKTDLGYAIGSLALDANGNLYGTTTLGLVFELSPPPAGGSAWSYQTIADLTGQQNKTLLGSLLLNSDGSLFGTSQSSTPSPTGSVFQMVPPSGGNGSWTYVLTYAFHGGTDGAYPSGGLVKDSSGNLYGATLLGGANNAGTIFELSPPSEGGTAWSEKVVYSFLGGKTDGIEPVGNVIFDSAGTLYGTTQKGGKANAGTAFELAPPTGGQGSWLETVLFEFPSDTGAGPDGGLIEDADGNLYGTTQTASGGNGQVFELKPPSNGAIKWTKKTLWNFPTFASGAIPQGSLLFSGQPTALFGTTETGGLQECSGTYCGTVFRVRP